MLKRVACYSARSELAEAVAVAFFKRNRGKSGLQRAGCQVTPGGCESMESAAENIPPVSAGKGEMVR